MRKISSYPFVGCDSRQIKFISDKIGIVYHEDNAFDVYLEDNLVSDEIYKGLLCYFKFLGEQRKRYVDQLFLKDYGDKMPSVNTHLDIVIMYINDAISFCKNNSIFPKSVDFLYRLNDSEENYRYLSCIINLLMNDNYTVNTTSSNSGLLKNDSIGNLKYYVDSIINGDMYKNFDSKVLSLRK